MSSRELVGESSRSIQEHALEHCAAARKEDTDSHKASGYGAPRGAAQVLVQSEYHTMDVIYPEWWLK